MTLIQKRNLGRDRLGLSVIQKKEQVFRNRISWEGFGQRLGVKDKRKTTTDRRDAENIAAGAGRDCLDKCKNNCTKDPNPKNCVERVEKRKRQIEGYHGVP